jgi:hypothetical protein
MNTSLNDTLGLDWDGVVSHFPNEMALLVTKFSHCVLITLNLSITQEKAASVLGNDRIIVEHCPDNRREDYAAWKAEMCLKHKVALMIDDDGYVVLECRSRNIPTLAVNAAFVQGIVFGNGL